MALQAKSLQRTSCVQGRGLASIKVGLPAKLCVSRVATRKLTVVGANPLESAINSLTTFITNSPLNEGKIKLAISQAGEYDEVKIKQKVDSLIADEKVIVFSWSRCPFCVRAKDLLNTLGADYTALELDTMGDEGKAIRAELGKLTKRTSMPNIFIKSEPVGGCNDGPGIMTLHKNNQLVPKLKAAGSVA